MALPDGLNDPAIQAELQRYHRSIQEEFKAEVDKNGAPENVDAACIDFAKKMTPTALAQIAWLMTEGDSHGVRLNASKYMIQLGREDAQGDGDPIKEMLKTLTKNKPENAKVPASAETESEGH